MLAGQEDAIAKLGTLNAAAGSICATPSCNVAFHGVLCVGLRNATGGGGGRGCPYFPQKGLLLKPQQ